MLDFIIINDFPNTFFLGRKTEKRKRSIYTKTYSDIKIKYKKKLYHFASKKNKEKLFYNKKH